MLRSIEGNKMGLQWGSVQSLPCLRKPHPVQVKGNGHSKRFQEEPLAMTAHLKQESHTYIVFTTKLASVAYTLHAA